MFLHMETSHGGRKVVGSDVLPRQLQVCVIGKAPGLAYLMVREARTSLGRRRAVVRSMLANGVHPFHLQVFAYQGVDESRPTTLRPPWRSRPKPEPPQEPAQQQGHDST